MNLCVWEGRVDSQRSSVLIGTEKAHWLRPPGLIRWLIESSSIPHYSSNLLSSGWLFVPPLSLLTTSSYSSSPLLASLPLSVFSPPPAPHLSLFLPLILFVSFPFLLHLYSFVPCLLLSLHSFYFLPSSSSVFSLHSLMLQASSGGRRTQIYLSKSPASKYTHNMLVMQNGPFQNHIY